MSRFGKLEFDAPAQGAAVKAEARGAGHWVAEARSAFARGDFEPALRLFARALEFDAKCVDAWVGQVRSLIELEQFREARLWADKALEHFPEAPELLAAKSVALARLGEHDDAMILSDASLGGAGDLPYVWLARGDVLSARREPRADSCFERARSLAPGDWLIPWLIARIRQFYRQFAAALKSLQEAIVLSPAEAVLWVATGQCQLALGLQDAAQLSFTQALQLSPHSQPAQAGLNTLRGQGFAGRIASRLKALFRP